MSASLPLACLVVDDEPVARTLLKRYVDRHPDLTLAGACANATEAATALHAEPVDLVILDIEMPGMSGIELADLEIGHNLETRPQVVFVTAKEDYAVQAFSVDATDYLVKPVRYSRFETAVERVKRLRASTGVLAEQGDASRDTSADRADGRADRGCNGSVFVKVDGRLVRIDLDDLLWIEAQGDYMLLHMTDRRYLIHSTMKTLEAKLPDAFVRVHRSFIVRVDRIKDIEDTTLVINRKMIPIGASYRDRLLGQLNTL